MAELTDWLSDLKVVPVPDHPDYPALVKPTGLEEKPKPACVLCEQQGKAKHKSYGCGKLTQPLLPAQRANIRAFFAMQYLIHRLSADLFEPYGSQSGFGYYGESSINFADQYTFYVLGVTGKEVEIQWPMGDLRAIGIYTIMRQNPGAPGRSFLTIRGMLQANDRVKSGSGCILDNKLYSNIEKVTINESDVSKAIITCEHDMSGLLIDNRADQTDPFVPTVTIVRQAGDPEKWTRIVRPDILKCHRNTISVKVEDLPPDKKLSLPRIDGTQGRCADPEPGDEETGKPATMQVWFLKEIPPEDPEDDPTTEIVDVTSSVVQRLKRVPYGPGWDNKGAYHSFLCLGTKDHNNDDVYTDLITPDVLEVYVTYFTEVPDDYQGRDWCAVGSRSCVHAMRDESGSFYNMDRGEAHLPNGEEYYCGMLSQWELEETLDGKWQVKYLPQPTGAELFTADCSLYGVCDKYAPKNKGGEGQRGFTLHRTANLILKELLMGNDIALVQYYPGYPLYYVKRMGRPSIHGLAGSVDPTNPTDWSQNIIFVQTGNYFYGDYDTKPHPDGGDILDPLRGTAWDGRTPFSSLTFGDFPLPGIFPTNIIGWVDKIDALRKPLDNNTDPTRSMRNYEDDCSPRMSRGVNASMFGRGVSQTSRIVKDTETFLLPAIYVDDDHYNTDQDAGEAVFRMYDEEQTGPGNYKYYAKISFKKLIATGKTEPGVVKTAVIHSATINAGGLNGTVSLELVNQPIQWSQLKNVGPGNSFNEVFTIHVGGQVFRPADHLQIRSSATAQSSYGNITDWVAIGDSASVDLEDGGFNALKFTVVNGGAYRGSTAPDFGAGSQMLSFELMGGYFQIPAEDLELNTGGTGTADESTATVALSYSAIATTLEMADEIPFIYGQYLQVEDTDEIMMCMGADYVNRILYVTRDVSSNFPAAPIPADTVIRAVMVYSPSEEMPYIRDESPDLPGSIDAGEYWYNPESGQLFFSVLDVIKNVVIAYTAQTDASGMRNENTHMHSHTVWVTTHEGVDYTYPFVDTMLTPTEFDGQGGTKVFVGDTELTIVTSGLPTPSNVFRFTDGFGHVTLWFDRSFVGQYGRIEIDLGNAYNFENDAPADVPEFATGIGWGKKRAVAVLADENDWLKDNVGVLVGKTVTFQRMAQLFDPDSDPEIEYTVWQEDNYLTLNSAGWLFDRGNGVIYLSSGAVNTLRDVEGRKICLHIS